MVFNAGSVTLINESQAQLTISVEENYEGGGLVNKDKAVVELFHAADVSSAQ